MSGKVSASKRRSDQIMLELMQLHPVRNQAQALELVTELVDLNTIANQNMENAPRTTPCQCCQMGTLAGILARDIADILPDESFIYTEDLIEGLIAHHPEQWSSAHHFGRDLTAQRLGRILSGEFGIKSSRDHTPRRGYCRSALEEIA